MFTSPIATFLLGALLAAALLLLYRVLTRRSRRMRFRSAGFQREHLAGIAESLAEGIILTDDSDRVLFINSRMTALTGYSQEDLARQAGYRFLIEPKDWPLIWLKNRQRVHGAAERYKLNIRRKDGSTFPAEISATPYRDASGEIVGTLGAITDITDRHRAEAALRESEERYRTVAETATDGIITIDRHSKILFVNEATGRIFGYSREEMLGQDLTMLMPEYLRHVHKAAIARYSETGQRHITWENVALPGLHKDGHEIPLELSFGEFQRDDARYFTGIVRDVTERKRTEQLQSTVYKIAQAAEKSPTLDDLYRAVHALVQEVMPAGNFYIALYDHKSDTLSYPYFVDEMDKPDPPGKPSRGMTGYVLRTGKSLLSTAAVHEELTRQGEITLIGAMSPVWLGVPLRVADQTIGVMAVQHYSDANAYGERERQVLEYVSSQIATAIERKRAEESLRQSENMFATLFRSSPDSMLLTTLDEGRYVDVNHSFEQLTGYSRQEVIGRTSIELGFYHNPAGRADIVKALREQGSIRNQEMTFRDRTGRDYTVLVSAELIEIGGQQCVLASQKDITDRKKIEEALRESEAKFSKAFFSSPDSVTITRLHDGKIIDVNESFTRLTGYSRQESIGRTSLQLNLLQQPADRDRMLQTIREKGSARNLEMHFRTKSGEVLVGLLSAEVIEWAGGQCLLTVVRDITDRKQIEEALRFSEERYRELFENATDLVYTHDLAGNFTSLNRAGERVTGYSRDEAYRLNIADIVSPEYRQKALEMMRSKLDSGGGTTYEVEIISKSGKRILLEVSTRLILHEGQPVGVQGLGRDVTERRRAEMERDRFLHMQTALSQAGHDLLSTLDLDDILEKILQNARQAIPAAEKGAVLLWNEQRQSLQVRRTSGYRDPRVTGTVFDVREGYAVRVALSRLPLILSDVKADAEVRYDGPIEEIRSIRSALAAPLIARNRLLGVISLDSDQPHAFHGDDQQLLAAFSGHAAMALENAALYEQVQESRENYRIVSDLVSDWAYALRVDAQGHTTGEWVTGAFSRVTGYTADEFAVHGWLGLVHSDDRVMAEAHRANLLKGEPDVLECRIVTKAGDVRWIRDYARPLWDSQQNRVTSIYGAAQDISERHILEDQLRQAQKMEAVGRLAGGVAHDFNNLLMVMRGYSELLLDQPGADTTVKKSAEHIHAAAERAASLTQQLLAFSRKQVLAPQVLNLNAVISNSEKLLRRLIGEDVELITNLKEDLGQVKADPNQIEQVAMNLAINARDAMPRGGKLIIETANAELDEVYVRHHPGARPGRFVMLAVTDTGTGMSPDTQARIFEPFFTTKEMGKGTGLGLATVYGIVKQSNGYIWVYSEPGRGTAFKVYLPRVDEFAATAPAPPAPHQVRAAVETILVVEDEDAVRALACEFLTSRGYKVLQAGNGSQAMEISRKHAGKIDLLMTDVVMPGMSGRELAERLTPERPDMRVLYVSGYTDEAIDHHGILDPNTLFLQKPFSRETLSRKLSEIFEVSPAATQPGPARHP